jgi:hypothetical protein
MHPRKIILTICLAALFTVMVTATGCQSGDREQSVSSDRSMATSRNDDVLSPDQADGMAADDADRFRISPAERRPPRRPPTPRQRLPVDQPRIGR